MSLTDTANQWFSGDASAAFGGQFLLIMPFTTKHGTFNDIGSIDIPLQNGQGSSDTVTAKL